MPDDSEIAGLFSTGAGRVTLAAGHDVNVTAGTVSQQSVNGSQLGGDSVLMQAGHDLSGTGGVGVTVGSSSTRTTDVAHSLSSVGSTVGSVIMNAGNTDGERLRRAGGEGHRPER